MTRVIDNPRSGERIEIRQSGEQTGGELLAFDLFLQPGAHVPARHLHPRQEERFTVLAGRMRFRLGSDSRDATSGDTIVVPAGRPHWFANVGDTVSRARVEVRPALRMEELLLEASAEQSGGGSLRRIRRLGLVLFDFQPELGVPNVPSSVVRALLMPLAWLRRYELR